MREEICKKASASSLQLITSWVLIATFLFSPCQVLTISSSEETSAELSEGSMPSKRITYYITDDYAEVWENGEKVETIKHYRVNGLKVATRDKEGLKFLYTDHLGSATKVASANGDKTKVHWYTPFGADAEEHGAAIVRYKYNGKEQDDTGVYYYGARYLESQVGRFISADTLLPNLYDSQQLNRFAYVRNNPVKFIDPDGHFLNIAIIGVGVALDTLVFGGMLGALRVG